MYNYEEDKKMIIEMVEKYKNVLSMYFRMSLLLRPRTNISGSFIVFRIVFKVFMQLFVSYSSIGSLICLLDISFFFVCCLFFIMKEPDIFISS